MHAAHQLVRRRPPGLESAAIPRGRSSVDRLGLEVELSAPGTTCPPTPRMGTTIDRQACLLRLASATGTALCRYLRGCAGVDCAVLRQLARLGCGHDRPHHPDVRPTVPTRIRPSDLVHVLLSTRQQARLGVGGLGGREAEEEQGGQGAKQHEGRLRLCGG